MQRKEHIGKIIPIFASRLWKIQFEPQNRFGIPFRCEALSERLKEVCLLLDCLLFLQLQRQPIKIQLWIACICNSNDMTQWIECFNNNSNWKDARTICCCSKHTCESEAPPVEFLVVYKEEEGRAIEWQQREEETNTYIYRCWFLCVSYRDLRRNNLDFIKATNMRTENLFLTNSFNGTEI